jgi:hypothetical protein
MALGRLNYGNNNRLKTAILVSAFAIFVDGEVAD